MARRAAVLLIDVQRAFFEGNKGLHAGFPNFKSKVEDLLDLSRQKREAVELIHVHASYTDAPWLPSFSALNPTFSASIANYAENTVMDFAKPMDGEALFHKTTFDAFFNTGLQDYLEEQEISQVYCTGLVTSACVLMTAHSAFARGFESAVLSDVCGDRSQERHQAALDTYGDYIFRVATLHELREEL